MNYKKWWHGAYALWRIRRNKKAEHKEQRTLEQRNYAVDENRRRMFLLKAGLGITVAALCSSQANANTVFTSYSFPGSNSPTSRTTPARIADIFNVKEYGVVGDFSTDDTTAVRAAVTAFWGGAYKGGVLFFPPMQCKVTGTIDIHNPNGGSNNTNGVIVGSGRFSTYIFGALNNGFVLSQADATNGPEELGHMSLVNTSTLVGSGALMMNNSSAWIHDMHFQGMINVLLPYNIFNAKIERCFGEANSDATTGYNGTLGIAGFGCGVSNWRSTSPYHAAMQIWGSNETIIENCGIENCVTALSLGFQTGWCSNATISGNILTLSGTFGSLESPQFGVGSQLFMRGLSMQTWGKLPHDTSGVVTITKTNAQDGSLTGVGWAGTYEISTTATVSTPVPVWCRNNSFVSALTVSTVGTEACYCICYLRSVTACTIQSSGGGSTPIEAVDAFGVPGYTPNCGFYINSASATKILSCTPSNSAYAGSFYFAPSAGLVNVTLDGCIGQKKEDNVTTATISNGSGGAGTILNVTTFTSGSSIGIGMGVYDSGILVATVAGNHASNPSRTGTNTTGTYDVDTPLNLSSRTLVIKTGPDWVMPTATASKAGVKFINCGGNLPSGVVSGLNTLGMTFTCLPGQAGSDNNLVLVEGMEYDIVDSNTATWGATVAGGGSNHVGVRYNGTNWTVVGK